MSGPSGKGKTSFLHLLAGLYTPQTGTVQIGDHSLEKLNDSERAKFRRSHFGIVFQKLNLLEHLTPVENILLDCESEKTASANLQRVGLSHRVDNLSSQLSLGEQQRVAIARVLSANKSIILADEPTSSLDDANAEQVMQLLLETAQNKTLVVVSHDQRLKKFFDRHLDFIGWCS